jgi:hypothetical protein
MDLTPEGDSWLILLARLRLLELLRSFRNFSLARRFFVKEQYLFEQRVF